MSKRGGGTDRQRDTAALYSRRLLSYHSFMAVTHFCVHSCNSLMLLAEQYTSVSSAYKLQAPKPTCILISLTYNKNKIGPKTDPLRDTNI